MLLSEFAPADLWLPNDWPYDYQITKENTVHRFLVENSWNCVLTDNKYQWKDLLKMKYLFSIYQNLCMGILENFLYPSPVDLVSGSFQIKGLQIQDCKNFTMTSL